MSDRDRPNVLLVVAEDCGPQFGCYGDRFARTPRLDALAASGVRFARHYTTQAVCSPGRSSILTGLHPHQNGQIGLATHGYAMYRSFDNLAAMLSAIGYRTGILGKLHVQPENAFPFGLRWNDPAHIGFDGRDGAAVARSAHAFFEAAPGPFFLAVNYPDAHLPLLRQSCGSPSAPRGGREFAGAMPWVGIDSARYRDLIADYYNCLERLDESVGLLLDALTRSGHASDTLVIVTADHGLQFPRGKYSCYEPGLHVPLILRGRSLPPGAVREELTSHVDLLPTIRSMVGLPPAPRLPGASLADLLRDPQDGWRRYLCAAWTSGASSTFYPQRCIRDERYKCIVNLLAGQRNPCAALYTRPGGWETAVDPAEWAAAPPQVRAATARALDPPPVELYDLHEDPWELRDLGADPAHAAVVRRLTGALRQWQLSTGDALVEERALRSLVDEHERRRRLRSGPGAEAPVWSYASYLDLSRGEAGTPS